MSDWNWISPDLAQAIHDRLLAEYSGPAGLRDQGAFESALARPKNRAAYEDPDAADLAAGYAFGIARNHPFVDGNKRTAWVLARLFLAANKVTLVFEREEAIAVMLALAAGELSEDELAAWFRARISAA